MGDMYKSPPENDDISVFLRQILLRSSSSPSPSNFPMAPQNPGNTHRPIQSPLFSGLGCHVTDRISAADSSSGAVFASSGGCFPAASSAGTTDNDPDEYDCESEEGFEALVEEGREKQVSSRNSSKRSRAAEVHNLSEKRRRCRINEKLKALQSLIPNSNKTDKASMLDDAIEYLKQLQLQVQMLTMRNGLSLYPMSLSGSLQSGQLPLMKMGFYEGNTLFNIPNQSTNPAELSAVDLSNTIGSETPFGMESSIQGHLRPLQLHQSSKKIFEEDTLPRQQLNVGDHSRTNSIGIQRPESVLLSNLECDPMLAPPLNGMLLGRSAVKGDIKTERLNF